MRWGRRRRERAIAAPRRPARRRDAGEARLWPFGAALGAGFLAAGLGLAGLTWLAWALLHHPTVSHTGAISVHDAVGVLQLVFASVAGAGALVALIVAYRRQKIAEADSAHDRTRVFNERFTAIAAQLGDTQAAVRLAGVHAMAGLADDWQDHRQDQRQDHRQTCVDVLCAYLRMPYEPEPGGGLAGDRLAFQASREVRHTVIRVITAHLNGTAAVSWCGLNFDFTGVVFDGGDFARAVFSGGTVDFGSAVFSGGTVDFGSAVFSGGTVIFDGAVFSSGTVDFRWAKFFSGTVIFGGAKFSGGTVDFGHAEFSGALVDFHIAKFLGGEVVFHSAKFSSGGTVDFANAEFSGTAVHFASAEFSGAAVHFGGAKFSGGTVDFGHAEFSGGEVVFHSAKFSGGGTVSFRHAEYSGGTVWFAYAEFSTGTPDFGPGFDVSHPPAGVVLPTVMGPSPDRPVL